MAKNSNKNKNKNKSKYRSRNTFHARRRQKPGTAPGTLTPAQDANFPDIHIIAYGPDRIEEKTVHSLDEIRELRGQWPVLWVNVDGLDDVQVIQSIGEMFGLHVLALEDVVNVHQRPKTEDYGRILYIVTRIPTLNGPDVDLEQISIFLGPDFVISFQERGGDCFNPLRDRIRRGAGRRIRINGADYLAYAIIDSALDAYFPVLESLGDHIDMMEERVLTRPDEDSVHDIHALRRLMHILRHTIWPMRDSINQVIAEETTVRDETRLYLRDCQDHVIQLLDIVENYRERASGLMDIYLSSLSNKMNQIMKVLTLIATIFMPLTFIVGIYGMNFNPDSSPWNMPELNARYGYPATMVVMGLIAIVMVGLFIRVGWLGNPRKK